MRPRQHKVTLSPDERTDLEKFIASGTAVATELTHARVLLKADQGTSGPAWGDAKIAGRAEEVADPERKQAVQSASGGEAPPGPFHLFRADVTDVVLIRVGGPPDHLVVESWHEGRGLRRVERR